MKTDDSPGFTFCRKPTTIPHYKVNHPENLMYFFHCQVKSCARGVITKLICQIEHLKHGRVCSVPLNGRGHKAQNDLVATAGHGQLWWWVGRAWPLGILAKLGGSGAHPSDPRASRVMWGECWGAEEALQDNVVLMLSVNHCRYHDWWFNFLFWCFPLSYQFLWVVPSIHFAD